jgi:pilus assembly protein CpaB
MRSILVVGLALLFGGSAALGVNSFLRENGAVAAPPPDTVPVVVTSEEVARFAALSPDMLVVRNYPKDLVPPGSLKSLQEAVDRVTLVSLGRGETVLGEKLSAKGTGRGMGAVIPKGMRAFTINTPNVASHVAGFILPGSKVDVLLTVKPTGAMGGPFDSSGGTFTTTLLQNMEILAVDQRVEAPSNSKVDIKELRSVTLLVTPAQAAKLDMGQNAGTLHLSLRNPDDPSETPTRPTTLAEVQPFRIVPPVVQPKAPSGPSLGQTLAALLAKVPRAPKAALPSPPVVIRTLRGTQQGAVELSATTRLAPPQGADSLAQAHPPEADE